MAIVSKSVFSALDDDLNTFDEGFPLGSCVAVTQYDRSLPTLDAALILDANNSFQSAVAAQAATSTTVTASAIATLATVQTIGSYIANTSPTSSGGARLTGTTITVNLSGLSIAGELFYARTALLAWSRVANVKFVETTGAAQISMTDDANATTYNAYTSTTFSGSTINSASIHITQKWYNNNGGALGTTGVLNSYGYQTYLHELGHALGLGHAGPYNGSAIYGTDNIFTNDSWQYSVMSYFDQTNYTGGTNPATSYAYVTSAMQADIYAIQLLYGAPTGQTANKFGYNATAGAEYNLAQSDAFTIYSSTGTADLDASLYAGAQTVNFGAGTFSSIKGKVNNIGLALNTNLTSYEGGSGVDTIILSNLNFNDVVNGNGGTDTVYVGYAYGSGYTISAGSTAANLTMAGAAGTDNFQNVEFVHFANGTTVSTASLILVTLTVAQAIAAYNANVSIPPMTILDTAANVAASLDTLQTIASHGNILKITLSGSAVLTLRAAQVATDATALATISGSYTLTIADTAANIGANFDQLQTNLAKYASIIVTDGLSVPLTVAQLTADAGALAKITGPCALTVADASGLTYAIATNVNKLTLTGAGAATITANALGDTVIGNSGADTFNGGIGQDTFTGGTGVNTFNGGGGNDTFGGTGTQNTAVFLGNRANYAIANRANGTYTITDLRANSPDATDSLSNVQFLQFADQTIPMPVGLPVTKTARDLNGDGFGDILFRGAGGEIAIWDMNDKQLASSAVMAENPGTYWKASRIGDFNGDGKADILWRGNGGETAIWDMSDKQIASGAVLATNLGNSWTIAGTGDFNGDGKTDILWRGPNGEVTIWDMNDKQIASNVVLAANPGNYWTASATGDFNGDGKSDILFRGAGGEIAIWDMNDTQIASAAVLAANPGSYWSIAGTGDFNGDGKSDIVWRGASGEIAIWDMNDKLLASSAVLPTNPGTAWSIAGIEDFNGDGKSDILLRGPLGEVSIWDMNDTQIASSSTLAANPGNYWSVFKV